jgi:hypothetical protein
MAKNKLTDLNNHLFLALERLNDDDMTMQKLEFESERVKSISKISSEIIKTSSLFLKVAVGLGKGDIDTIHVPEHLQEKKIIEESKTK